MWLKGSAPQPPIFLIISTKLCPNLLTTYCYFEPIYVPIINNLIPIYGQFINNYATFSKEICKDLADGKK